MFELLDFSGFSIWINIAVFAVNAAIVWIAGTRLVRFVDRLSKRTGMGQGFAGMLLLGGIVSLAEISTVSTAAFTGSPLLALNNLLGRPSASIASAFPWEADERNNSKAASLLEADPRQ